MPLVFPERSGGAILYRDCSDLPVSREQGAEAIPVSTIDGALQGVDVDMLAHPCGPRRVVWMMEAVEQLEHQTRVLDSQLFDAETALKLGKAGSVPGYQALRSVNFFLSGPSPFT